MAGLDSTAIYRDTGNRYIWNIRLKKWLRQFSKNLLK
jgi:hypothetical protein